MRWTLRITGVLLVLLAAYTVWPFVDLYRLGRAIERRDVAQVAAGVEFRALRGALNRQILATYLRLTGKEASLGPFGDFAVGAAAAMAEPAFADIASADRLIRLFAEGWPEDMLPGMPGSRLELVPETLGRAWQLYADSEYSGRDFYIRVPVTVPPAQRLRLQFRLIQARWKLYEVELPEALRERLAREAIRLMERK